MRNYNGLIAIILLLLVCSPAYADTSVPHNILVSIFPDPFMVANELDTVNVRVTVIDNLNQTIGGLPVFFVPENPNLGSFIPESTYTLSNGTAQSQYKVGMTSGTTYFTVRVQYEVNGTPQYRDFIADSYKFIIQNPYPDSITFNTSKDWLVANGADSTVASVVTYNKTYPIPNLDVDFLVLESGMGIFQPVDTTTNALGTAQSQFTTQHKSGNATLKALISYDWEGNKTVIERQYTQKIDHDYPYSLSSYNVPSEVSVGATVPLILRYIDQWGNPIDNRRIAENVTFMVSSPLEDAFFTYSNSSIAIIPVNAYGEAMGMLRASLSPAIDVVRVDPDMGSIPDNYYFIQALANRSPISIEQEFEPEGIQGKPPKVYSDGQSYFSIVYTVRDEFFNGVMNTPVKMTIFDVIKGDLVEERTVYTNSFGKVMLTYGPKTVIGRYNLIAQAIGNTSPMSPTCSREIWFVSQEAEDLQFTAIPDNMASRDVEDGYGNPAWEPAMLMAKVIDENGNPVEGETVTFSNSTPIYESSPYPPIVTNQPELLNTSAITNTDGFAIAYFNPGAFSTNWTDYYYDDTASGSCVVTARWENVTRGKLATQSLTLIWKNYPYLSIETEVSPQTVNVTDTVNVKISLKGDGWALRPKPIDAVLCTDRSGSMLQDNPDRMVSVMGASKAFVGAMHVGPTRDHIGLISFGGSGWANLSPTHRTFSNQQVWCRVNNQWVYRTLNGNFSDWRNVYGVYSSGSSPTYYYINNQLGFWWVKTDSYNNMEMTNPYNINYWPYTESYDTNSVHQLYINTNYLGNNRNYGDFATIENALSDNPGLINTSISKMVPYSGTPMRYGIYRAIKEINTNGRVNAIRAIIVLGDGDYNYYGDPLARGSVRTWSNTDYRFGDYENYPQYIYDYKSITGLSSENQNLSNYARNNNVRIYSIGFANALSDIGKGTLQILAESTGGQYYDGNAANIDEIYTTIAGLLLEEAGVNTTMDMGYDQIEVNYDIVTVNETFRVFDYVPSTEIDSYDINMTRPVHDPAYPYNIDQSDEFNLSHKLTLDVGTVKLGQTWEAIYTLRVLTDGTINIFGNNSFVYFNGTQGPSQLRLPKTYITGVANMTSEGVNSSELEITVGDSSETETNIITWPIYRQYTGILGIKENYYISTDGGMTWILVGFYIVPQSEWNSVGYYSVNRNQFPPGSVLQFRVVGNALDAPGPVIGWSPPVAPPPQSRTAYIILK